MLDRMQRLKWMLSQRGTDAKSRQSARAGRAARTQHLRIENLEDRLVLATNTWLPGGGGVWELPQNWSTGKVPTAADDVVINLNAAATITISDPTDVANSVTTTNATLQLNKSLTIGGGSSTFNSPVNILPGSTLSIGAKAQVAVNNVVINDQGALTIGTGAAFTFTGGSTTPGDINVAGVMTVSGATFTGGSYTGVFVRAGGELTSTNCTYATAGVGLSSGAILSNTDLTGNDFSRTDFSLPATYIPRVANRLDAQGNSLSNKQFGVVDVTSQTLLSGTQLELTLMGTANTKTLFYRFEGGFTIANGATLYVDPQVPLNFTVQTNSGLEGTQLEVDGALYLNNGDSVTLFTNPAQNSPIGDIFVTSGGLLNAQGTSFANAVNTPSSAYTFIDILPGATFIANGNNFANTGGLDIDDGANIGSVGNPFLINNDFRGLELNLPVTYVPIVANQYDSSGNLTASNKAFGYVGLQDYELPKGQTIELTAMGTVSTASLVYQFRNLTIDNGGTLIVDPNLRLDAYENDATGRLVGGIMSIGGNVIFGAGDTVSFHTGPSAADATKPGQTSGIVVTSGTVNGKPYAGTLTATGTNFLTEPGSFATTFLVQGGGTLAGSGNLFGTPTTTLAPGAIITDASGNPLLTGNQFANTLLSVAATSVPALVNNLQFTEVDLYASTLTSGTLNLTKMGTNRVFTIFYKFVPVTNQDGSVNSTYTVATGATLNFDPNLTIDLPDITLQANGTVNFGANDAVVLSVSPANTTANPPIPQGAPSQIIVNGTVNAPSINLSSTGGLPTALTVNSGGVFTTVGATLAPTSINLNAGSKGSITISAFGTPFSRTALNINGTSNFAIHQDNLTALTLTGNTPSQPVVAVGSSTATIDMTGNYWGTTDLGTIAFQKIYDQRTDGTRPLINFEPIYLGTSSTFGQNVTTVYSSAKQTLTFNASVIGVTGTIGEGDVTFTVLVGTTAYQSKPAPVINGQASGTIDLPAGLAVGLYAIQASYSDVTASGDPSYNFVPSIDTTKFLSVTQATTTIAGPTTNPRATYSSSAGEATTLTANVASTGGPVGEGSVTFTVFSTGTNPTQIGSPITVNVGTGANAGTASTPFTLPANTPAGKYTVFVMFNGSQDYQASSTASYQLTVDAAPVTVTATGATATFSSSSQTVTLTGSVTSSAGPVNGGVLTFTVLGPNGAVGNPVTVNVVNTSGSATFTANASFTLQPGAAAGNDTILVAYTGAGNFSSSTTPGSSTLIIKPATTAITVNPAQATFNTAAQPVTLTANVTSNNVPAIEGAVTFKVIGSDGKVIGPMNGVTGNVVNGVASVAYTLPAYFAVGSSYAIQADYTDNVSTNYLGSTAVPSTVTVVQATTTVGAALPSLIFSPGSEQIVVKGVVLDNGVAVNDGSVTFSVFAGTTLIGSTQPVGLIDGATAAYFTLPPGVPAGTVLGVVANYTGNGNYSNGSAYASTVIAKATPTVSFPATVSIVYGTPLSGTQLAATASVPGTFTYSPAAATVLNAGANQTLSVAFVPTDSVDYAGANATTTVTVAQATPTFSQLAASQSVGLGSSGVAISGRIGAPTAIPAGESVSIVLSSGTQSASGVATINADGTFATTVDTSTLGVGSYGIRYSYAGSSNFAAALATTGTGAGTDTGTGTVTVTPAAQTIAPYDVPTSYTYGMTFHINPTSSSGLPVVVTGTNAIVTPSAGGGYDVTPTSGTLPVLLVATQPGSGNFQPAAATLEAVATVRAIATIVIVPNFGIVYDGLPHTVGVTTNPPGLATALTYTLNGVPVATPVAPGAYAVSASIVDANYQGTASSFLTIVPSIGPNSPTGGSGSTGGSGGSGGGNGVANVAVAGVTLTTANKGKTITAINVTFTGPLTQGQAANLSNYRLATAGARGSFDAKNARTYKFSTFTFDATTNTVHLRLLKAQKLGPAYQLRISNIAGGTVNATINKKGRVSL